MVLYLANWHLIATGQSYVQQFVYTTPSPLRHMWSLAIEEQFYVLWPLVVIAVGAIAKRGAVPASRQYRRFRLGLLVFCALAGAASFVRMLSLYTSGGDLWVASINGKNRTQLTKDGGDEADWARG